MTIYREVVVTLEQRDALSELGSLMTHIGRGRYASALQDVVERWDESVATESTFPVDALHQHIDEIVGVL